MRRHLEGVLRATQGTGGIKPGHESRVKSHESKTPKPKIFQGTTNYTNKKIKGLLSTDCADERRLKIQRRTANRKKICHREHGEKQKLKRVLTTKTQRHQERRMGAACCAAMRQSRGPSPSWSFVHFVDENFLLSRRIGGHRFARLFRIRRDYFRWGRLSR